MTTYRLDIEYDGAGFAGWAAQPGLRTCEGVLRDALATILRAPFVLRVAGRTDAGVHASGQVASVATAAHMPAGRLRRGLNGLLPPDMAVPGVGEVHDGFDARADAVARAYEYRVLPGVRSPLRRGRVLEYPGRLDAAALAAAAGRVVGTHDFTAFTPTDTQHVFFDRTVTVCRWDERGDELVLSVEADAFLRHMVRVLVGTLLEVGRGVRSPESLDALLAGAPRTAAGPTAPAHALTLVGVRYRPAGDAAGPADMLRPG